MVLILLSLRISLYFIFLFFSPRLCPNADAKITIPSNGSLTALAAIVPIQLLAYELSILKGINPDKPRNLAKSVTVD